MHGYGTAKNDAHAWLTRSGSRSTVPSPRGHFFDLVAPENFAELPLNQQRNIVAEQYRQGCEKLKALKEEAKTTKLSRRAFDQLRDDLVKQNDYWAERLKEINKKISALSSPAISKVFVEVAKKMLPADTFRRINEATQARLEEIQEARANGDNSR